MAPQWDDSRVRELPSGTVTFLFTDIEGSTRLLHELGDSYADALAEHRRVLRGAFAEHDGVEVDTQGDAFFVAFARAGDALAAARDGQTGLAAGPIRVRMGVHTGEPIVTDEGYVGLDVHRAARIGAAGHGGQVVVSQATRALVAEELRDLGEHRLKDLEEPIALYQLGDGSFPPLKTISNTNLPRPASSFVGRAREVEDVLAELRDGTRLLTLTGSGGSGKTRLAIEAAGELVPDFKAGVFWVPLAAVRDAALVTETIARTIGAPGALADHVGERELLLLLDNLEQVVEAAPELATVVEACPNLRLLVTSRERLRVRGEVEYPVEPLADPEAVELFCARARAEPDPAVEELCRALDNLPLALELAAARSNVLSPSQILERLSQRLDLFTGGRDTDPRQQTLRATIEWSHDLLDSEEQRLFARLAVFRRGSTLEAAEDVAGAGLDPLQSLVDKALLRHTDERFWMLETIREFAAERLRDSGEAEAASRRHAEYIRVFTENAAAELLGRRPGEMVERVEQDLENVRGALRWSFEEGDLETALAIFVSLERFWSARTCPADLLALAEEALARADESVDLDLRARAAWVAGFQAARAGEYERPTRLYERSLVLFRRLGKDFEAVRCLSELAIVRQEHGLEAEASALAEEALVLAQALGEPRAVAAAATCRATLAYFHSDFAAAAELYEEALRANREAGAFPFPIASCLYNIGLCARALGDWDRAERALREALEVATDAGNTVFIGNSAVGLGYVMLARGDLPSARSFLRQGLEAVAELGNPGWTGSALNLAAAISAAGGDDPSAARLWGAADVLLEIAESPVEADDERVREAFEPRTRTALGASRFAGLAEEGRRLPVEGAVRLAVGPDEPGEPD
jgi:predicted ATPase/class 3 adenylate cyclase